MQRIEESRRKRCIDPKRLRLETARLPGHSLGFSVVRTQHGDTEQRLLLQLNKSHRANLISSFQRQSGVKTFVLLVQPHTPGVQQTDGGKDGLPTGEVRFLLFYYIDLHHSIKK